jgi:GNAT superfamily N-acetyltransferase
MRLEARISERLKKAQIGLKDTFAVFDIAFEYPPREFEDLFPFEVFEGLDGLIERTVHGTRIERFTPHRGKRPFHSFEIRTEAGEILSHLNMIYLRKPLPCYYLVYVEVLPPFRGQGLGNKILKAFREFVEGARAVGLLDNIIPSEEPTYGIYTKLGWTSVEELMGYSAVNGGGDYMVFIPSSVRLPDLRDRLLKLLYKIKRKRAVIDMQDNESMVKRTIEEFRSVYDVLEILFETELSKGIETPFMRFMYTKFITKVLGFQRRIATLLGFTGGESLGQISVSDQIKDLPVQSYSLWDSKEGQIHIWGEEEIIECLPEALKKEPTLFIENLPLYKRPYLISWMEKRRDDSTLHLRISDLFELGFDPTKLREFYHEVTDYIFERVSPGFLPSIEKKRKFLSKIAAFSMAKKFYQATVQVNPPLAIIRDRGNLYILRKKVGGIHSDEALAQLRASSSLKTMNRAVGIDHTIVATINEIIKRLTRVFGSNHQNEIEDLAFFVPWDLERNIPKVTVNIANVSLDTVWIA